MPRRTAFTAKRVICSDELLVWSLAGSFDFFYRVGDRGLSRGPAELFLDLRRGDRGQIAPRFPIWVASPDRTMLLDKPRQGASPIGGVRLARRHTVIGTLKPSLGPRLVLLHVAARPTLLVAPALPSWKAIFRLPAAICCQDGSPRVQRSRFSNRPTSCSVKTSRVLEILGSKTRALPSRCVFWSAVLDFAQRVGDPFLVGWADDLAVVNFKLELRHQLASPTISAQPS